MNDFKKIRLSPNYSKLRSRDAGAIHRASLQWLKSELEKHRGETNVVITHHGPSPRSLPGEYQGYIVSGAYISNLEPVMEAWAPAHWVHGHLHSSPRYQVGHCQVICNPRGYPDQRDSGFTQSWVLEV